MRTSNKKALIAVAAIVVLTAAGLGYWLMARDSTGTPEISLTRAEKLALGQQVYAAQCARCHGLYFEGQPDWRVRLPNGRLPAPPHDGSGHTWHHPDSYLFGITKYGMAPYAPPGYESDMPAYEGILSDEEIVSVLVYIKAHWPEAQLDHQRRVTVETDGKRGL